jgi:hypothetical protein
MTTITKKNEATIEQPTKAREKKSRNVELSLRGPTGPRTKRGKRKTRYNAVKHGIFSPVVLKGRESKAEYQLLLASLQDYFQPEGVVEGILIDKLAMLLWRHRRLVQAECAEIGSVSEFIAEETSTDQLVSAEDTERQSGTFWGMLRKCTNPFVYGRAVRLLEKLRTDIRARGFDMGEDTKILRKLYGPVEDRVIPTGLFRIYANYAYIGQLNAEDGGEKPGLTTEEAQQAAIGCIRVEIKRLKGLEKACQKNQDQRMRYTIDASLVPSPDVLDRLLRYEASLDRAFDRTLTQLERLQRQRRGDKDLPPIKVDVAA